MGEVVMLPNNPIVLKQALRDSIWAAIIEAQESNLDYPDIIGELEMAKNKIMFDIFEAAMWDDIERKDKE